MEFAVSWTAAKVARDSNVPIAQPALVGIEGLWGRLCADIGWMNALRRATSTEILSDTLVFYRDAMRRDVCSFLDSVDSEEHVLVTIADDVASEMGWIIDPHMATEVLVPAYSQIISEAFSRTVNGDDERAVRIKECVRWGFHSDGDISEIYPVVAANGFSFVHIASVDYGSLSKVVSAAKNAGLIPIGGISSETLASGNLSDELCRQLALIANRDGLVICDDGGITQKAQLESLLNAFVRIPLY